MVPAKERLKWPAKDRQATGFQPAFQYPGVNPAEIDLVLKISIVQVGGRQAGVFSEQACLNFATCHEHQRTGPMIGAAAGVLGDAPAEFAESHQQDAPKITLDPEVLKESFDRVAEFPEQAIVRAALVTMGVIASLGDIKNPGWQPAANQPGNELQRMAELAGRI